MNADFHYGVCKSLPPYMEGEKQGEKSCVIRNESENVLIRIF